MQNARSYIFVISLFCAVKIVKFMINVINFVFFFRCPFFLCCCSACVFVMCMLIVRNVTLSNNNKIMLFTKKAHTYTHCRRRHDEKQQKYSQMMEEWWCMPKKTPEEHTHKKQEWLDNAVTIKEVFCVKTENVDCVTMCGAGAFEWRIWTMLWQHNERHIISFNAFLFFQHALVWVFWRPSDHPGHLAVMIRAFFRRHGFP